MAVIRSAGLGHGEAARGAVEEARPQTLLQPLNMGADRGLRDFESACGSREAPAVHDAREGGDPVERIHPLIILKSGQYVHVTPANRPIETALALGRAPELR